MKKTLYSLMALCFLHKSMAYDSTAQDNAIAQAFSQDNDIYRSRSFTIEPLKSYPGQVELTPYKRGKRFDLLSRVSLGNGQEEKNLSDERCEQYIDSYNIICSLNTSSEQATKILERRNQVDFYRKNKSMPEEKINEWIQWFIEKKEWGVIVDEKSKKRAKDFVLQISNQCRKNFILRHSLSVGDKGLSGSIVLYPGHNPKIIEDLEESGIITAPIWAIGSLEYQINFSKEILHVNLVSVESFWRSRGHGYALARYLADFAKEHFQHIARYMTVSCRNSHSQRIFEKAGFVKNVLAEAKLFYGATHYREVSLKEWEREQAVMTAWNDSHGQRYLVWLTKAYPEIFPNQYHKVGYRYY
ncbi:MAG: GNAT family N-acetyltransferase [Candidatus Paracaedibacteraceae bacterium]|nr:GNAT family N-acetyltransferase [Candidatus Paracaedibacteraceae bacterium]